MSDQPEPGAAHPTATVGARMSRRWRFSLIWTIPIVTAVLGAWLAWDTLSRRGPLITVTFQGAEGLQAGQSHVRYKAVDMGLVERVVLTNDLQRVAVSIRMTREAEPLLTDRAQFWVVKPRFFAGSVSGLETLLSGAYIGMLPAGRGGAAKRQFTGLEDPPVLQSDVPGRTFLLQAPRIGNMNLGSPVFYRDLTVGEVLGWDIADMAQSVTIHAFVRAPYDRYVHDNSRFWNASGAAVKLGANGVELQIESLRAVVLGGIAFDTPSEARDSPVTQENHAFPLFANKDAADVASYQRHIPLVAYFGGSVAGLSAGASVVLRGIRIGEVQSVKLRYDMRKDAVVVPVEFEIQPERIADWPLQPDSDLPAGMRELVRRGMRVRLDSASIITGQKQLTIDVFPNSPPAELQTEGDRFVVPTLSSGSDDVMGAAGAILAKLGAMPFAEIGDNLNGALRAVNNLANGDQLKQSLTSLQATLAGTQDLVKRLNAGMDPALQRLPAITASLEDSVRRANQLLGSMDNGYGGSSAFNRDFDHMMLQVTDTARSLRVLADLLARHPEALIRGRTDQGQ
jgi:paraquat-inducible protein B